MTASRTRGREYALQILYEVDVSGKEAEVAIEDYWQHFEAPGRQPGSPEPEASLKDFTGALVRGVVANRRELDESIEKASINWRLDRMPRVDRNVLRLATWELAHAKDVPMKVVINEAIELAKRYGSEESGAFVNGILDKVAESLRGKGAAT